MKWIILLVLLLMGCTSTAQTAFPTQSKRPTATITKTLTPTRTASPTNGPTPTASITPSSTSTPTLTNTPTDTATPTPSASPTITNTPAPTLTADSLELSYPATITLTPWQIGEVSAQMDCLLKYYDLQFIQHYIFVNRRDKSGYFECMQGIK